MRPHYRPSKWLLVLLVTAWAALMVFNEALAAGRKQGHSRESEAGRLVVRYAEALAQSRVSEWASLDLACLTMRRHRTVSEQADKACWEETLKTHRALVHDQPETGIFGALGRGVGLGLLSETHRHADYWREYVPAVFVSPAVIGSEAGPPPGLDVLKVWPVRQFALINLAGPEPVGVSGQTVEILVSYRDPLTAPLALRPGEVWWASGTLRRYGPVKEVTIRFVVVSGLRKLGYPVDRAVLNEALPAAPVIAGMQYGSLPQRGDATGSAAEDLKARIGAGGLVLGSARWWERKDADQLFSAALTRAERMPRSPKRTRLLTRLTLIDPADPGLHAVLADDRLQAFLREGQTKSGISGPNEAVAQRLAELYWNLQAQTWRQELTEVAVGHSTAAEAFYQAMDSFERLAAGGHATPERLRQLGALYRWNNDAASALKVHEALVKDPALEDAFRGRVLSELAWDRIQWLSWERRYGHPWLDQAGQEAEEALRRVEDPAEKVTAAYALVLVEALRVPRDPARLEERVKAVKAWHDRLSGAVGVWPVLVGNDLVKALVPDGARVTLPAPVRAPDVLDVELHAKPPRQDIVWQWNFDQDIPGALPAGFVTMSTPGAEPPSWRVAADTQAPTPEHLIIQDRPCAAGPGECAHLLLAERIRTTYPDVTVQVQDLSPEDGGEAGIALAVRDSGNFYAVTLNSSTGKLTTRRVVNGRATVLGEATVKLAHRPWHTLRVQRINSIHLDRGRLSVFADGVQVAVVADAFVPAEGLVGLVTFGRTAAKFDGLHVLDLVSNRPLSQPAAY